MLKKLISFSTLLIFLSSCSNDEEKLTRVWTYEPDEMPSSSSPVDSAINKKEVVVFDPISFIDLQKNGNYTSYLPGFDYGKWYLRDSILLLTNFKNKNTRFLINKIHDNSMVITANPFDRNNKAKYTLTGNKNEYQGPAENLFSIKNNKWRIKPLNKENDTQIKERLLNHLHYWELYFKWGMDNNKESLNVRRLPSPLKIYQNGFQLLPPKKQPPLWQACFYDEEDCIKAWHLLDNFFKTKKIDWPDAAKGKYFKFITAFKQMREGIK